MICNQETLKEIQEMTEVRWMLITPELAREMLKKNTNNIRNIANGNIQAIVNDINNDGWRINGETICFNSKGVLSNGQHRLTAIAKAGKPVICLVVSNVPEDDLYDVGKKRAIYEIMRANGYEKTNVAITGAANVILYGFIYGGITNKGTKKTIEYIKDNYQKFALAYELSVYGKDCICRKAAVIACIFCILTMHDDSAEKIRDIVRIASTGMPIEEKPSTPGLALRLTLQDISNKWGSEARALAFDAMYQAYLDYSSGYNRKRKYTKTPKSETLLKETRSSTGVE